MDIILTAIVIGFLFSVGLAFISGFVKAWKELSKERDAGNAIPTLTKKENTMFVFLEPVTQKEMSTILVYNKITGKFLCQGQTNDKVFDILRNKFKDFTIVNLKELGGNMVEEK